MTICQEPELSNKFSEPAVYDIISLMGETIGQSTIHEREMAIAQEFLVSPSSSTDVRRETGLPENVAGLTIVDLAAGASTLTAALLEQGASAYALDCAYDNRQFLIKKVYGRFLRPTLNMVPASGRKTAEDIIKRNVRRFLRSLDRQPDRYKTGWLTEIPFEDDFADWTISSSGISLYWQFPEIQRKAMMEAIRITKPGGVVAVTPFLTNAAMNPFNPGVQESHLGLFDFLVQQNVGQVTIERVPSLTISLPDDYCLKVVKAAPR